MTLRSYPPGGRYGDDPEVWFGTKLTLLRLVLRQHLPEDRPECIASERNWLILKAWAREALPPGKIAVSIGGGITRARVNQIVAKQGRKFLISLGPDMAPLYWAKYEPNEAE